MINLPSPNHGPRPPGAAVAVLLVHYTGMPSAAAALARLCAPGSGVSAHYTIDEDGTVYRHVAETRRAWHAGVSSWRNWPDLNSISIGVELVNHPKAILADEPTASLDDANCQAVLTLLLTAAERLQAALLVATHDARVHSRFPRQITMGVQK
ncbi:N-acetylmuramoyl-L-alanine amidase [uncultured Gammaproteobacteria bacterium]